ncbi:MAG TPA: DMT family transporter [Shinella sp.]|jgi:transporter family-2 protein|uniref:DMT family transporter n=1 Tax=Shinella sp. TaxID=1870904 RepID=UPI0029A027C0|nr:DMT family transporter [Shinella sp.]MDX3977918.1 DMT family transporter [Shinella sp.]HEV7246882.1 DMT family transporter [Shinella sp.]
MAAFLWALLGIAAGACIAIQAPINALLGRGLTMPVAAACVSFLSGAAILALVVLATASFEGRAPDWRGPAFWLYVAGGALGTVYVTTAIFLTPRIGAAAVMAFAVSGQLLAGILLDRIGFLGMAVRELSLGRIAGAMLLVVGALMIRFY